MSERQVMVDLEDAVWAALEDGVDEDEIHRCVDLAIEEYDEADEEDE